jgi:hypothetical protein
MTKQEISAIKITLAVFTALALVVFLTIFNSASSESMAINKYQSLENNLNTASKAAKMCCESLNNHTKNLHKTQELSNVYHVKA